MRIWLPPGGGTGHLMTVKIIVLTLAAVLVAAVGAVLAVAYETPGREWVLLALTVLVTLAAMGGAISLSRKRACSTLIFCQNADGQLCYIDVGELVGYRRGFLGFAETNAKERQLIEELAGEQGRLRDPDKGAWELARLGHEIQSVSSIREGPGYVKVRCLAWHPNGFQSERKLSISRKIENIDTLTNELERRQTPEKVI